MNTGASEIKRVHQYGWSVQPKVIEAIVVEASKGSIYDVGFGAGYFRFTNCEGSLGPVFSLEPGLKVRLTLEVVR